MAPTKTRRKRKPKGKSLAETLRAKDEKKAALADLEARSSERDEARVPEPDEAVRDEAQEDEERDEAQEDEERDEAQEDEERDEAQEDEERDEAPASAGDSEAKPGEEDRADEAAEHVAAAMGYQRYVILGFLTLWVVVSYVFGRALEAIWSELAGNTKFIQTLPTLAAVPHEGELISRASISLVLGAVVGAGGVLYYFKRRDVRRWADDVAEETSKVKWPTRKEIGNYTVIVITASALLTAYLTLLDRFWAFVTNLIYATGA
jgi:preprotein translocase subunit SecE